MENRHTAKSHTAKTWGVSQVEQVLVIIRKNTKNDIIQNTFLAYEVKIRKTVGAVKSRKLNKYDTSRNLVY